MIEGLPVSRKIAFDINKPNLSNDENAAHYNDNIADKNTTIYAHDSNIIEDRYHEQSSDILNKIETNLLSRLTNKQQKAIMLMADGGFDDIDISRACNVTLQVLSNWKRDRYFSDALTAVYGQVAKRLKNISFSRKEVRVQALNNVAEGLNKIIAQRGAAGDIRLLTVEQITTLRLSGVFSEELAKYLIEDYGQYNSDNPQNNAILSRFVDLSKVSVPGYETGLIVSEPSHFGMKHSVDTQLIKTLQETLSNIAKELGQITNKEEIVVQQKLYGGIDFENDI